MEPDSTTDHKYAKRTRTTNKARSLMARVAKIKRDTKGAGDYYRQIIRWKNGTFDVRVRYTSNNKIYFTTRQGYEKRSEAVRAADGYDAAAGSGRVATHGV